MLRELLKPTRISDGSLSFHFSHQGCCWVIDDIVVLILRSIYRAASPHMRFRPGQNTTLIRSPLALSSTSRPGPSRGPRAGVPYLFDDKLQITEWNEVTVVFSGFSKFLGRHINGSMDRVTGDVGMVATAEGWASFYCAEMQANANGCSNRHATAQVDPSYLVLSGQTTLPA